MLESFMAVPLHFAVEFLGFLLCAGGALLVLSKRTLIPGAAPNRFAAAAGLAVLAAAQALHGSSRLQSDGDPWLVALRTLGFALLVVAVGRGMAPAAGAAVAVRLRQSPALAAAAGALVLAATSFGASRRTGQRTLARLSLGALWLGTADVLVAFSPPQAIGVGPLDRVVVAAHLAKLAGFVFVAAWLWAAVRSSIRTRFVASFAVLLVAVVLVLSSALMGVISNNIGDQALARTRTQLDEVSTELQGSQLEAVKGAAEQVAAQAVSRRERGLDRLAEEQVQRGIYPIDFIVFTRPGGGSDVLGSGGHGPNLGSHTAALSGLFRISIASNGVVNQVEAGRTPVAASLVRIGNRVLLLAAGEFPSPGPKVTGVAAVGRFVDRSFLLGIRSEMGRGGAVALVTERVVTDAGFPGTVRATRLVPGLVLGQAGGKPVERTVVVGGRSYFSASRTLQTLSGEPVGTLVVATRVQVAAPTRTTSTVLFLVTIGVGAVALFLAWLFGRRITKPIQQLTTTARAVREGELQAQASVSGSDEVGQLGETFNEMTAALFRMTNDLRKAARDEHALRARIETVVQSMADGLVAVDADQRVVAFNPQAERLTQTPSEEAVGKPVDDVLDVRDLEGMKVALPVAELEAGSVGGVMLKRPSGDPIPIAITSAVLRDESGEVSGAVAVLRDMTREREVERMKSEFLSNISHELRTPLTPIRGYAELLGRPEVPRDKAQRFARGVLESTQRLERIVELLIDFSAMEAGRLAPRSTPIDISRLIEDLARAVGERSPRHRVEIDIKKRLPRIVGDERLLRRSLEEVLDNAVKFSPEGGTIRLEARGASAGNGAAGRPAVEVVVTDEGIGIAPENLERIFSEFQQLDGSETRPYGGLGLGLAFVQRIVEAHHGRVSVKSEPHHGTTLTITIPASRSGPLDAQL